MRNAQEADTATPATNMRVKYFKFEIELASHRPVTLMNVLRDVEWACGLTVLLNTVIFSIARVEPERIVDTAMLAVANIVFVTNSVYWWLRFSSTRNRLERVLSESVDFYKSSLVSTLKIQPDVFDRPDKVRH